MSFICTIACRVAISRVIRRRRVTRALTGTQWLVRRLLRTVPDAALETAWRLGGARGLTSMIDQCFESAPKRRRPKCGGLPLPIDDVLHDGDLRRRDVIDPLNANFMLVTDAMRAIGGELGAPLDTPEWAPTK